MRNQTSLAVLMIALLLLPACGNGGMRVAVSGTVHVNGVPLESGTISFSSTYGGPAAVGLIKQGQYLIAATEGPWMGPNVVRIMGYEAGSGAVGSDSQPGAPPANTAPQVQFLPEKYNTESELLYEILREGNTSVNFDLTLDPPTAEN